MPKLICGKSAVGEKINSTRYMVLGGFGEVVDVLKPSKEIHLKKVEKVAEEAENVKKVEKTVTEASGVTKVAGDTAEDVATVTKESKKIRTLDAGNTHVHPDAEDLKMSRTVQRHTNDIIKKGENAGQLSRPYIDSKGTTLLLDEIMEASEPVPDIVLESGLRWDVPGTFRGTAGTWELVVDTDTNTVVHFNFVAQQ